MAGGAECGVDHLSSSLVLLLAIPLTAAAAGLSEKYRAWDKSPDAYFLTSDERAAWKKVKTDEDAAKFVADYFERRDPELPKVLLERIAVADKYFSSGKTKGSETLRGKVIIIFGPPSKLEMSHPTIVGGASGSSGDVNYTSVGESDPRSNAGPGAGGLRAASQVKYPVLTITYDDRAAPRAIGKTFKVELLMKSEASQEAKDPLDLDEKFEVMAKASHKPPAAPKP